MLLLFVCLFACVVVCLFVCLFVPVFVCLVGCLFVCVFVVGGWGACSTGKSDSVRVARACVRARAERGLLVR